MPQEELKDLLSTVSVPVSIGLFGWAVQILRTGVKTWRQLVASLAASVFVSVIVYWGLDWFKLPPTVVAAFVGLSGYMGGKLLDRFHDRALRAVDNASGPGKVE